MTAVARRAGSVLLASILIAAALVVVRPSPPTASATMPGAAGRIVFVHADDGIYTVDPDGSALRQITTDGSDHTPEWSPDGRLIAFARDANGDDPGGSSIWLADANGGNAHQLTPTDPDADDLWPRFTPDGGTILFTNCLGEGCDGGISAIGTDGTGLHRITPNAGTSFNLGVPSPDGRRIAFMRWHLGGATMRIYLMRADGTRKRPVTPIRLEGNNPDWAPDGRTIVFASNINRPGSALYTIHPDGSGLHRLTRPKYPRNDFQATYSPDGGRIALASDRRGGRHPDLFVMAASGGALHRVPLPFRDVFDARWGTAPVG